jgi:hypothetical protein
MSSPTKRRRRKPQVTLEQARKIRHMTEELAREIRKKDEDEQEDEQEDGNRFLTPFVLGFNVALILILVPSIFSIYSVCQEASVNATCPTMVPAPPPKVKGLKRLFQRKNNKSQEEAMMIASQSTQDPTDCACQLFWQALDRLGMDVQDKLMRGCADEQALSSPDPALKQEFLPAFTPEKLEISTEHQALIVDLTEKTRALVADWDERASQVSWGGPGGPAWFQLPVDSPETDLEALEGASLMYSYLRIMQWPHDLYGHFPFKLCAKVSLFVKRCSMIS